MVPANRARAGPHERESIGRPTCAFPERSSSCRNLFSADQRFPATAHLNAGKLERHAFTRAIFAVCFPRCIRQHRCANIPTWSSEPTLYGQRCILADGSDRIRADACEDEKMSHMIHESLFRHLVLPLTVPMA